MPRLCLSKSFNSLHQIISPQSSLLRLYCIPFLFLGMHFLMDWNHSCSAMVWMVSCVLEKNPFCNFCYCGNEKIVSVVGIWIAAVFPLSPPMFLLLYIQLLPIDLSKFLFSAFLAIHASGTKLVTFLQILQRRTCPFSVALLENL